MHSVQASPFSKMVVVGMMEIGVGVAVGAGVTVGVLVAVGVGTGIGTGAQPVSRARVRMKERMQRVVFMRYPHGMVEMVMNIISNSPVGMGLCVESRGVGAKHLGIIQPA